MKDLLLSCFNLGTNISNFFYSLWPLILIILLCIICLLVWKKDFNSFKNELALYWRSNKKIILLCFFIASTIVLLDSFILLFPDDSQKRGLVIELATGMQPNLVALFSVTLAFFAAVNTAIIVHREKAYITNYDDLLINLLDRLKEYSDKNLPTKLIIFSPSISIGNISANPTLYSQFQERIYTITRRMINCKEVPGIFSGKKREVRIIMRKDYQSWYLIYIKSRLTKIINELCESGDNLIESKELQRKISLQFPDDWLHIKNQLDLKKHKEEIENVANKLCDVKRNFSNNPNPKMNDELKQNCNSVVSDFSNYIALILAKSTETLLHGLDSDSVELIENDAFPDCIGMIIDEIAYLVWLSGASGEGRNELAGYKSYDNSIHNIINRIIMGTKAQSNRGTVSSQENI